MKSHREPAARIDEDAARWVARADRGLDDAGRAQLAAWLAGDSRRMGAYARHAAIWMHAERAGALGSLDDVAGGARGQADAGATGMRRRHVLAGGGLLAAGVAAAALWPALSGVLPRGDRRLVTATGEVRRVLLDDGSVLTLDAASEVALRLDRRERTLRLLAGGALLDVARDGARLFRVTAGDAVAETAASAFAIRLGGAGEVAVTVERGWVALRTAAGAAGRFVAGDSLTVAAGARTLAGVVRRLDPDGIARALSWREGLLSFDGDTLADAAARFARWSAPPLVVDDATARRTVTGLFAADDPAGFADAVAVSLDLDAIRAADGIHLRARRPGKI